MKEKDYSIYEGKEVVVKLNKNGEKVALKALVTGCEYDIGITVEAVTLEQKRMYNKFYDGESKKRNYYYYLCIQGPFAPDFKYTASYSYDRYAMFFELFMDMVKLGEIDEDRYHNMRKIVFPDECLGTDMATCAFL